jgi:hypothetical protein
MPFLKVKVISPLFDITCFVIAIIHITQYFQLYFEYQTTSKISQKLDNLWQTPGVAFCSRYLDIIDTKALKRNFNINIRRTDKYQEIVEEMTKVTVKQILYYTPPINDSIISCSIRDIDDYMVIDPPKETCQHSFDTFKFYMQEFVCYQYQFKKSHPKSVFFFSRISNSLNYKNVIYKLVLSEEFSNSSRIMLILFNVSMDDFPFPSESRNWAPITERLNDFEASVMKSNMYSLSYSVNEFQKLPPPYDTDCNEKNTHSQCFMECLNENLKAINRTSFSEITHQLIDLKHVNERDLQDKRTREFIKTSEESCREVCKRSDCIFDFTATNLHEVTDVMRRGSSHPTSNIVIQIKIPNFPKESVIHAPKLSLLEFLVYLLNCIGIYFGICVLSLNPLRIMDSFTNYKKTDCFGKEVLGIPRLKLGGRRFGLLPKMSSRRVSDKNPGMNSRRENHSIFYGTE